MSEKEYIVSLKQGIDYDQFWQEMETVTQGHVTVPDRSVDIVNERPGSLRSCHYALTDSEADSLRQDSRVYSVEIPPEQRSDVRIGLHAIQFNNYAKSSSDTGNFVNWALRRCVSQTNVYGTGTTASGGYPYTLDGTGVDVVISDSGLQVDHPEFQDNQGNSRVQLIDWYDASGLPGSQSVNFYRDFDGHGTHVAGIATGKNYGWAKNARVYSMKVLGLEGSGDSGTGISVTDCFDTIKLWHQLKPIDPLTGHKRPTVVNMSWGYYDVFANINGGIYRGTPWSGSTARTDLGMVGTAGRFGTRVNSVDVDVAEMVSEGIVVCISAGNFYQKIDVMDGLDYDNSYNRTGVGTVYYNRGSSPSDPGAIRVGSIDTTVRDASTEYKSIFSDSGPGVDIYAPGSNIMSATSNTNEYGNFSYSFDSNYKQLNISGTSMSSPQVAGLTALYLQLNPWAIPAQVKSWLLSQGQNVIWSTGLDDDYTDNRSLKGSVNSLMFNPFNREHPLATVGDVGLTNIAL